MKGLFLNGYFNVIRITFIFNGKEIISAGCFNPLHFQPYNEPVPCTDTCFVDFVVIGGRISSSNLSALEQNRLQSCIDVRNTIIQ